MKINLNTDKKIADIFEKIRLAVDESGRDVYLVGGPVRDILMKRPLSDLDFVVVGDGIEFAEIFAAQNAIKKIVSYKRFGTAMVPYRKFHLEFVSARSELYEEGSRKPKVQKADLQSDLSRRDFTVNTLAVKIASDADGEVIDIFDGLKDLKEGIIRTPLEPEKTFYDDPLRILRAVRFAAQLDFRIEEKTFSAMRDMAGRLEIISVERIAEEFKKLMMSGHPRKGLHLLDEAALVPWVVPELAEMKTVGDKNGITHKNMFEHTLEVVQNAVDTGASFTLRLAALLHDIGKPATRQFDEEKGWTFYGHAEKGAEMSGVILSRLLYANELIKNVQNLVLLHQRPAMLTDDAITDSAYRRLLVNAGDQLEDLLLLSEADISTKIPGKKAQLLNKLSGVVKKLDAIEAKDRLRHFVFPVNGEEIMEITGLGPGKSIGKIKTAIKEAILEGELANEKEEVITFIRENRSRWL